MWYQNRKIAGRDHRRAVDPRARHRAGGGAGCRPAVKRNRIGRDAGGSPDRCDAGSGRNDPGQHATIHCHGIRCIGLCDRRNGIFLGVQQRIRRNGERDRVLHGARTRVRGSQRRRSGQCGARNRGCNGNYLDARADNVDRGCNGRGAHLDRRCFRGRGLHDHRCCCSRCKFNRYDHRPEGELCRKYRRR
ncbi:hypothetical protein DSECCO2_633420 [anaerobic digester metagenome]